MNRILVVVGRFNEFVTGPLLEGAKAVFAEAGVAEKDLDVVWVPGSFEIPVIAARAARSGKYGAIVGLGCVIRGETPHFDYVAGETAAGLMNVSVSTGVPVVFGVLTTDNAEQALNRCGLKHGHKGRDAAQTALEMMETIKKLKI